MSITKILSFAALCLSKTDTKQNILHKKIRLRENGPFTGGLVNTIINNLLCTDIKENLIERKNTKTFMFYFVKQD